MLSKLMSLVNNNTLQIMNLNQVYSMSFRKLSEIKDKSKPSSPQSMNLDKTLIFLHLSRWINELPKLSLMSPQIGSSKKLNPQTPWFKNSSEKRPTNTAYIFRRLFLRPYTRRGTSMLRWDWWTWKTRRLWTQILFIYASLFVIWTENGLLRTGPKKHWWKVRQKLNSTTEKQLLGKSTQEKWAENTREDD